MSWVSLLSALAFLLIAIQVTALPASPSLQVSDHRVHETTASPSLAETTSQVTAPCPEADRACAFLLLFRFVSAFEGADFRHPGGLPQTPLETLTRRRGDPEAKALLLAALLDHHRLSAYLAYALPDVYVLACGVSPEALEQAISRYLAPTSLDASTASSSTTGVTSQEAFYRLNDESCVLGSPAIAPLPGSPVPSKGRVERVIALDGSSIPLS